MANLKSETLQVIGLLTQVGFPMKFAKMVAAQACLESANFTSNVYKQNNNAFGMKMPSVRQSPFILGPGTRPPGNEGATPYAKYKDLANSVADVMHLYNYNKITNTPAAFQSLLGFATWLKSKNYFGPSAQTYAAGMATYYDQMADIKETDVPTVTSTPQNFLQKLLDLLKKKWLKVALIAGGILVIISGLISNSNKKSKPRKY